MLKKCTNIIIIIYFYQIVSKKCYVDKTEKYILLHFISYDAIKHL